MAYTWINETLIHEMERCYDYNTESAHLKRLHPSSHQTIV
jgi:hypothetical protein